LGHIENWKSERGVLCECCPDWQESEAGLPLPKADSSIVAENGSIYWPGLSGEMAERIRTHDWASTPLGPIEAWPQSLKSVVDLMLCGRQPAYIAFGPALTSLYNDAYIAILGTDHPKSLGQPYSEVWRAASR